MPRFEPFPGIRYDLDRVDPAEVTAPPYDVISPSDRAVLAARHDCNVVAVDLPVDGDDPYARAAQTFERWRRDGVLVQDEPSLYVYRMDFTDEHGDARRTTGVLGALELSRPGEGGILPHEYTTPKARSDRLNLQRATHANLSAVWGLSPAAGLTTLLDQARPPDASWADDDGVIHSFWRVHDAGQIEKICATVGTSPVVIADGHHRYETALAYRDERRSAAGAAGAWDLALAWIVELSEDQLTVQAIHRLLSGLPDGFDLAGALAPWFDVTQTAWPDPRVTATMLDHGGLVLVEPDGASLLVPRPDAFAGVRDLDTVRLDAALASLPDHSVTFQHGVGHVSAAVASGEARAGVLVRPVTVAQIIEVADGGERMPPKSTFFHPKPRTGVVFRALG